MTQTVKIAKHRAKQDPDRDNNEYHRSGVGVRYGSNLPGPANGETGPKIKAGTTRGACT